MKTLCLYLVNVVVIALPIALFEIWLEKYKSGWGGEFYSPFWGKKIHLGFLLKAMEKTYLTPYHLIMFGVIIPGIFVAEYLFFRHLAGHGGWILSFAGIAIVPLVYFVAVWIGMATLEDFLWFALNWRFPDALQRLFRGEMAWHTEWSIITSSVMVPSFYLTNPILVTLLFFIQSYIIRLKE